jgi:hypothetical protein
MLILPLTGCHPRFGKCAVAGTNWKRISLLLSIYIPTEPRRPYARHYRAFERPSPQVKSGSVERTCIRKVGRIQLPTLLLELDSQVHFSRKLLSREPKSGEELLGVYGALLASGTDRFTRSRDDDPRCPRKYDSALHAPI